MSKFIIHIITVITMIIIGYECMIGKGRWRVLNVQKCPEDPNHLFIFDINRHKLNRSHVVFSGWLEMNEVLEETMAARIDVCKHVDGGCKPYQVLADDSFCHMIEKYAKKNVEQWFDMVGLEMPICPLPKGRYEVKNYLFDYNELPEEGIYGEFQARAYVLQGIVEVSCVILDVVFQENDDE